MAEVFGKQQQFGVLTAVAAGYRRSAGLGGVTIPRTALDSIARVESKIAAEIVHVERVVYVPLWHLYAQTNRFTDKNGRSNYWESANLGPEQLQRLDAVLELRRTPVSRSHRGNDPKHRTFVEHKTNFVSHIIWQHTKLGKFHLTKIDADKKVSGYLKLGLSAQFRKKMSGLHYFEPEPGCCTPNHYVVVIVGACKKVIHAWPHHVRGAHRRIYFDKDIA